MMLSPPPALRATPASGGYSCLAIHYPPPEGVVPKGPGEDQRQRETVALWAKLKT